MNEKQTVDKKDKEELNKENIKQLFKKSADVRFQEYTFHHHNVMLITCTAMLDEQLLYEVVINRVEVFLSQHSDSTTFEQDIKKSLYVPTLEIVTNKSELISSVYNGKVVLYFEKKGLIFSSDIAKKPNRTPEETKTEVPVKGPRDNFIEDVFTNVALIRKRIPTNSLCVETFQVGRRTKTTVAILYFDDIVNKDILNGIKNKIEKIDVDIIFSGDVLMEYVEKRSSLFPRHDYTGRPDFAVQSLARGRVLILVDGVTYGIITPINLFLLFKSGEDNEYPSLFSSFERLLRLVGILIGMLLPAFWLALITYHQDQLPLQLLATVEQANTGLPLPKALEMLLMLIMFELFREAGLRLPEAIGGTLSVVGGLIIGDAAIRAGITSPAMVVVIAISVISTFTLLNQSFVSVVSILRFFSIIITAFLGLFGFFMALYFIILYITNIRIFGTPYINVTTDIDFSEIKKTFIREAQQKYIFRPSSLKVTDKTRQKEESK